MKPPLVTEAMLTKHTSVEARTRIQSRRVALEAIKANMEKASARMKYFADRHRTERSFEIGRMVYLKMQPYRHNALGLPKTLKLHSKFLWAF